MKLKEYLLRWLGLEYLKNDVRNITLKLTELENKLIPIIRDNAHLYRSVESCVHRVVHTELIEILKTHYHADLKCLVDPKFNKAILDLNEDRLLLHSEISNLKLQLEDVKLEIRAKTIDVNNTGATFEYKEKINEIQ